MLYIEKPLESCADDDLTFYAGRWLHNVKRSPVFVADMVEHFALYMLKRGLIHNPPPEVGVLLGYLHKNLVGLRVADTTGPSPFMRN